MKQPIDKTTYTRSGYQRGLSLIELMISITIGLLILVSLSTLFIQQSKARAELDKSNRMIDNGRYALELLSGNLRLAGFYDSFVPSGTPTALPDPCNLATITNAALNADVLRLSVQGVDATTASTPAFSASCAAVAVASAVTLQPGSDILVIRRASTASISQAAAVNGTTYLQVSSCPTGPAYPGNYNIATAPAAFPLLQRTCATVATQAVLRPFLMQVYFVSPNNNETIVVPGCPHTGDCIPTLKRIELDPSCAAAAAAPCPFMVTPLVEGVEYMQVDYGIDGNANGDGVTAGGSIDGVADSYSSTCTACNTPVLWANYWSNVVSVKINILARNQEKTTGWSDSKTYNLGLAGTVGPFRDAYKRHAYTQLVRLVNPAGRRETP